MFGYQGTGEIQATIDVIRAEIREGDFDRAHELPGLQTELQEESVRVMQCPANVRTLSSDHGPVSIETLDEASEEYAAVAVQLLRTMSAELVTIEKISNQSIQERYDLRKSQMHRRNQNLRDGAPHEQMMWHGTR
jgi:hypothetical protein